MKKIQNLVNRPVMKIRLQNFWRRQDLKNYVFNSLENILDVAIIEDADQPDLVFHSGFGKEKPCKGRPNIFIQLENPERLARFNNQFKLPSLGLVEDSASSVELPFWFMMYEMLLNPVCETDRKNAVCSMFSHPVRDRERIIKFYNAEKINGKDKIRTISKYAYNIAVENSYAPVYITEKLPDACAAGCIPIYKGGDLSTTPFNQERVIAAGDRLPDDYRQMMELPVFNANHGEMYSQRENAIADFFKRTV